MARTVSEHLADPRHAAALADAPRVGRASGGDRLEVEVGLWLDARGRVTRARFRATTCAALIAYADAACALLEQGLDPRTLDAARVAAAVRGVHPLHRDRAAIVARAVGRALPATQPGASP